jgi:hypothetical protein
LVAVPLGDRWALSRPPGDALFHFFETGTDRWAHQVDVTRVVDGVVAQSAVHGELVDAEREV